MKILLLILLLLFSHTQVIGPWPFSLAMATGFTHGKPNFAMGNLIFPMDNHFSDEFFRGLSFI